MPLPKKQLLLTLAAIFLLSSFALPQSNASFRPDGMDTVLYGVAYYHEYMPYDRLEQDVQLMQQAGISVVRVGESSWGLWEPEDGHFDFAWMDRMPNWAKSFFATPRIPGAKPGYPREKVGIPQNPQLRAPNQVSQSRLVDTNLQD